jgi:hypothetical protein
MVYVDDSNGLQRYKKIREPRIILPLFFSKVKNGQSGHGQNGQNGFRERGYFLNK